MHRNKRVILPLALGLANVQKEGSERLGTANLQMQLELNCKLVKGLYCGNEVKMSVKDVRYEGERMMLTCVQSNGKAEFDKVVNLNQQIQPHISLLPFQVSFTRNGEELQLNINKQLLTFTVYNVPKSRFVKNQKLEQIINQQKEQCGPLSMDKSERILLEPQTTTFPIIGLWISSSQPLRNSRHLSQLVSHIVSKGSKIFFSFQGRTFFYLVTMNFQKNVPQLHLVQWKTDGKSQKTIKLCKKDAFTKSEITVSTDQQSNLQFTLRSDEKVPETLLNIPCSPIKFPSCSDDTKSSTPDSPRFKLDRSDMVEQQCASLKRLVKSQEIEINDLRAEILRLAGELRQCKRHKHYCESQEMSASYISSFKEHQKSRRLTRSDLNFDSPSPCNEERQQANAKAEQLQNIWDRFQIVDK